MMNDIFLKDKPVVRMVWVVNEWYENRGRKGNLAELFFTVLLYGLKTEVSLKLDSSWLRGFPVEWICVVFIS